MAMDFPASPTEGQTYQAPGGPLYTYRAPAWRSGVTVPQIAKAQRNRIINGAMRISQENGTAAVTTVGGYPADQWQLHFVSSSAITSRQVAGVAGEDIISCIGASASPAETAAAAGEYIQLAQTIEGARIQDFKLGTASSMPFVIAFSVYIPVAGTYWVAFGTYTASHHFLASYTISAGEVGKWVRKQVTVPAGAINAGTWPISNVGAAALHFTFHCGATYTGVAGFQAANVLAGPGQALGLSTGGGCYLSNVGLYLDPDGSGIAPLWELPDEAQELAACMRYYYKQPFSVLGYGSGGTLTGQQLFHPAPMRVAPAMTLVGGTYANASTCNLVPADWLGVRAYITVTAAGTGYFDSAVAAANARM